MKEGNERRERRRELGRKGLAPVMAGAILIAATVGVGVVGFVVLNVMGEGSSSVVHTCYPSTAPECANHGNSTGEIVGSEAADIIAV